MANLYTTIEERKLGIFESPTGTVSSYVFLLSLKIYGAIECL